MRYTGTSDNPLIVTAADFKNATHIRAEDIADDAAFDVILRAAQEAVLDATARPAPEGEYEFEFDYTGWRRWWFPCAPVVSIDKVEATDEDGNWVEQSLTGTRLIQPWTEPQLLLPATLDASADQVRITATCGHGAARIPQKLRQAIILLAKEWQDAGITVDATDIAPRLTMGARRLISSLRYMRPHETAGC